MTLKELKKTCLNKHYPIMMDDALDEIVNTLKGYRMPHLLELGSCVGYSALYLALHSDVFIDSLEKDFERHVIARENVQTFNQSSSINMIYDDALVYEPTKQYEVIVFDAAKAQNKAFFDRYFGYLKDDGVLYVDNIDFHGHVENQEKLLNRRNLYKMVGQIKEFTEMLEARDDLVVETLHLGDGLLRITRV